MSQEDPGEGDLAVCADGPTNLKEKTSRRGRKGAVSKARAAAKSRDRFIKQIEKLADGEYHSLEVVGVRYKPPGLPSYVESVRVLALIPWLKVERESAYDQDGSDTFRIKVTIDHELRAICEDRSPRPELDNKTRVEFYKELRAHITRSRKENHDRKRQSKWSPEAISMRHQSELLDYIEDMLDRVPP